VFTVLQIVFRKRDNKNAPSFATDLLTWCIESKIELGTAGGVVDRIPLFQQGTRKMIRWKTHTSPPLVY